MKIRKFNLNFFALMTFVISLVVFRIFGSHTNYQFSSAGHGKHILSLTLQILIHNYSMFLADLLSFIFGRWLLLANLIINMVQLGWILGTSTYISQTILILLPHGVLEISAILLMANLCWNGIEWVLENRSEFFLKFLIANIILITAAFVEAIYLVLIS